MTLDSSPKIPTENNTQFAIDENNAVSPYPYENIGNINSMLKKETDRGLIEYLANLNLKQEDLRNKVILDIGSGKARFAKEATKKGMDIIAMDSMYLFEQGQEILKKTTAIDNNETKNLDPVKYLQVVASEAENIPLENESVDIIINMFSAFLYCKDPQNLEKIFYEQLRVLKSGGKIFIVPVVNTNLSNFSFIAKEQKQPSYMEAFNIELGLEKHIVNPQRDMVKARFKEIIEEIKKQGYTVEVAEGYDRLFLTITKPD